MKKVLPGLLLLLTVVAVGQELSDAQAQFIQTNAHRVGFEEEFSKGDWTAFGKAIEGKKMVLLGEFNHETSEVFQIKNDMIRYLHQEHGFTTILFESGIGEMIIPDQQKNALTPQEMTYGFFSYWRSKEFHELMSYVQNQAMNIAGFDVQRFGGSFKNVLSELAREHAIDSSYYQNIEERFGEVQTMLTSRAGTYDEAKAPSENLISDYQALLDLLPNNPERNTLLVRKTLDNRIHYIRFRLQFLQDRDWNKRWLARDSMMAENVTWLTDNFYSEEKVIVYAHNFHIARHNDKEEVMGEYLTKLMGDEMYVVGVFAGSGTYGNDKLLLPPDSTSLDLKHAINTLEKGVHFLHIPAIPDAGSDWLHQPIIVNDTFIDLSGSNTMTLSKYFDGLLLIDQVGQ